MSKSNIYLKRNSNNFLHILVLNQEILKFCQLKISSYTFCQLLKILNDIASFSYRCRLDWKRKCIRCFAFFSPNKYSAYVIDTRFEYSIRQNKRLIITRQKSRQTAAVIIIGFWRTISCCIDLCSHIKLRQYWKRNS